MSSHSHLSPLGYTPSDPTWWASDKGWEADEDSADAIIFLPSHSENDEELASAGSNMRMSYFNLKETGKKRPHIRWFFI